jgi:hypothetical protein
VIVRDTCLLNVGDMTDSSFMSARVAPGEIGGECWHDAAVAVHQKIGESDGLTDFGKADLGG